MLPHSPPILLAANYDAPTTTVTLVYDRPLIPGNVAAGQIGVRVANFRMLSAVPSTIVGNTVVSLQAGAILDLGPDICDYNATPPEIVSTTDVAAPAFVDFPLT